MVSPFKQDHAVSGRQIQTHLKLAPLNNQPRHQDPPRPSTPKPCMHAVPPACKSLSSFNSQPVYLPFCPLQSFRLLSLALQRRTPHIIPVTQSPPPHTVSAPVFSCKSCPLTAQLDAFLQPSHCCADWRQASAVKERQQQAVHLNDPILPAELWAILINLNNNQAPGHMSLVADVFKYAVSGVTPDISSSPRVLSYEASHVITDLGVWGLT